MSGNGDDDKAAVLETGKIEAIPAPERESQIPVDFRQDFGRERVAHRWIDRSSTIGTNATAQKVCDQFIGRISLFVQNVSVDTLWLQFGKKALQAAPSIQLVAGASFSMEIPGFVDESEVWIIGPNAGAAFVAREA